MIHKLLFIWQLNAVISNVHGEKNRWRYFQIPDDVRQIEVNNWFQLVYSSNSDDWNVNNLTWYYENQWCEVLNQSLPFTSGRCKHHGQYGFGLRSGSSILEYKVLVVHFSHKSFNWQTRSTQKRTGNDISLDLYVWISEPNPSYDSDAKFITTTQTEHSKRLSRIFHSNGERPIVDIRNILKSSESIKAEKAVYLVNESIWHVSLNVSSEVRCLFATIKSSITYSLLDKFVRETIHMIGIESNRTETRSQQNERKLKSLKSRFVQDQCAPQNSAYLSPNGVHVLSDFWRNKTFLITANLTTNVIDDLLYNGDRILLLIDGKLYSYDELENIGNGLPNASITSIVAADSCHEIPQRRNIVFALIEDRIMSASPFLFMSNDSGMNFSEVNFSGWHSVLSVNHSIKDIKILDTHMHSVFDSLRLLVRVEFNQSFLTVLLDFSYTENRWRKSGEIDADDIRKFAFLLSTSRVTLLWSDQILIKTQGNSSIVLLDLNSQSTQENSQIENVITDKNGRYVVILKSREIFTGNFGVNESMKISSLVNVSNSSQIYFDLSGRLFVIDERKDNGNSSVARYVYPLFSEIDTATNGKRCEVVSFSCNVRQGWYEIDIGESIQITAVMISLTEEPFLEVLLPARDEFNITIHRSSQKLGKYFEQALRINISTTNEVSSNNRPGIHSTLVIHPSNASLSCTKWSPQTAFLYSGCPSTHELLIRSVPGCKTEHTNFIRNYTAATSSTITSSNQDLINPRTYCDLSTRNAVYQISSYLTQHRDVIRGFSTPVMLEEIHHRKDFMVVSLTYKREKNQQNFINFNITFLGIGEYVFRISTSRKFSFCNLQAFLIVTVESKATASNSIYVITSVSLGITISLVLLFISFLKYRKKTIEEHEKEAEIIKRQQELRYLSNLYDFRENLNTLGTGGGRRKSSMLREGLRKRNISLSAISEVE